MLRSVVNCANGGLRSVLVLASCCCICFAVTAEASSTRVISLGGGGDYLEDADNILRWYGSIASYPDIAVIELGDYVPDENASRNARGQGGGAHYALDSTGDWGVATAYFFEQDFEESDRPEVHVGWGRSWSGFQAGAAWSYRGILRELTQEDWSPYRLEKEDMTCGLGLRADLGPRTYLDVAADLTWTDRVLEINGVELADDQGRNDTYGYRARVFHRVSEQVVLVPVVAHSREMYDEFDLFADVYADAFQYDNRLTTFGIGADVFPDADVMLVLSAAWVDNDRRMSNPQDPDTPLRLYHEESTAQKFRIGLESRARSWLTLRAGVSQIFIDAKTCAKIKEPTSEETDNRIHEVDSRFDLALGLAMHLGDLDVDMVFNDDAPFALGSFLTGGGREEDVNFTRITLTYSF